MGISSFFNQIANNFRDHYRQLSNSVSLGKTPKHYYTDNAKESAPQEQLPADSYLPSNKSEKPTTSTDKNKPASEKPTYTNPTEPKKEKLPANAETGDAAYFSRKSNLDYKMMLQFDLSAIQGIAESLAHGDTQKITEFAAGGFGLKAGFDIKSSEIIETNMAENIDGTSVVKSKLKSKSRLAGAFDAQAKNFNLQSFYNESTKMSKSMKTESSNGYRRTVNKFALRYRMDSKFNFSFLNRLNVQTKQVADADPNNLENYVKSAGNVAESGTTEMLSTFFDTVDSYLNGAESDMLAKADKFFTMAVNELGFSEESVSLVKDKLVDSIESFFGKVDDAVSMIASKFVPQTPETIETPVVQPEIPSNKEDTADLAMA